MFFGYHSRCNTIETFNGKTFLVVTGTEQFIHRDDAFSDLATIYTVYDRVLRPDYQNILNDQEKHCNITIKLYETKV